MIGIIKKFLCGIRASLGGKTHEEEDNFEKRQIKCPHCGALQEECVCGTCSAISVCTSCKKIISRKESAGSSSQVTCAHHGTCKHDDTETK